MSFFNEQSPNTTMRRAVFELEHQMPSGSLTGLKIEVTHRCNQSCPFCYICQQGHGEHRDELGLENHKRIVDDATAAGALSLCITGGEPFVCSHIWALLEYARKKLFFLEVHTNGSLLDDTAVDRILHMNLGGISFSLHGSCSEVHDRIVGLDGAFNTTMNAIRRCLAAGMEVIVHGTVSKLNFQDVGNMLKMSRREGFFFSLSPHICAKMDEKEEYITEYVLDREDLIEYNRASFRRRISEGRPEGNRVQQKGCEAGIKTLTVLPDGSVTACNQLPIVLGKAPDQSLYDIFHNSELLQRIREAAKWGQCPDCEIGNYCQRCFALAYRENNDMFSASTSCCYQAECMAAAERQEGVN